MNFDIGAYLRRTLKNGGAVMEKKLCGLPEQKHPDTILEPPPETPREVQLRQQWELMLRYDGREKHGADDTD